MRRIIITITILILGLAFAIPDNGTTKVVAPEFSAADLSLPKSINFQGYLYRNVNPMDTTMDMWFGIYDSPSSGTQLFQQTINSVIVTKGWFTVTLDNIPNSVFPVNGPARYLEVKAPATGQALSPRISLVSVSYAYHAITADTAEYTKSSPIARPITPPVSGTEIAKPCTLQASVASPNAILRVKNQGSGYGIWVDSAGNDGVYVNHAGDIGVNIIRTNSNGVRVYRAGQDGLRIDSAGDYGVRVLRTPGEGFRVANAGSNGVDVDSAGDDGVYINYADNNGLNVARANYNGVRVARARVSGLYVDSAGYNGVDIRKTPGDGVYVSKAGRYGVYVDTTNDDGVVVANSGDVGVKVINAADRGMYVGTAGTNGVEVDSAGLTGVYVRKSDFEGVRIKHAESGVLVDTAHDNAFHVVKSYNNGLYVDKAFRGVRLRDMQTDGIYVEDAVSNGIIIGNAGLNGFRVHNAGASGLLVDSADKYGVYVGDASRVGVVAYADTWGGDFYTMVTGSGVTYGGVLAHSYQNDPDAYAIQAIGKGYASGGWVSGLKGEKDGAPCIVSLDRKIIINGTAKLIDGKVEITYPKSFTENIRSDMPISLNITPNEDPLGVLFTRKNGTSGFSITLKEIPGWSGDNNINIDWVAIGTLQKPERTSEEKANWDNAMRIREEMRASNEKMMREREVKNKAIER